MSSLSMIDTSALAAPAYGDADMQFSPPVASAPVGGLAVNSFGGVITAQRVAVPRNPAKIMQDIRAHCAMNGTVYVYSWQVNDNANQRKTTVEGGTIKLANDLARLYGNCVVDMKVEDAGSHTIFYARFTDIETGFSMTRPFRQRNSQSIGKKYDAERAADMVFQIGASKAIRNVILNALSTYANFAVEESKKAVVGWLSKDNNKEKAWTFIDKVMEEHQIDIKRVEAVVGRPAKDWTVQNLARVLMEMRGIDDGLTVVSEIYPTAEAAAEVIEAKTAKQKLDDLAKAPASTKTAEPAHDPETGEIKPAKTGKPDAKPAPAPEDDPDIPTFLDRRDGGSSLFGEE